MNLKVHSKSTVSHMVLSLWLKSPLELCDRSSTGEVTAQQYQMQPQFVGGVGLPSVSSGSPSLRPGSAGMPAAVQASPPLTPSSVAGHSQTVRYVCTCNIHLVYASRSGHLKRREAFQHLCEVTGDVTEKDSGLLK